MTSLKHVVVLSLIIMMISYNCYETMAKSDQGNINRAEAVKREAPVRKMYSTSYATRSVSKRELPKTGIDSNLPLIKAAPVKRDVASDVERYSYEKENSKNMINLPATFPGLV
ncbi:hypothetical protein PUN28_013664 [Cardiocondyla obscurior]|uniref:Uncharacterized protein n=1 Tax=Cardiocondyla obscurior TaxID=286306 RepID=A0AAW2F2F7_9HYME